MTYVAGWNMPGYLPTSEPAEFDTLQDAREYIASEIAMDRDASADDDDEVEYADAITTAETASGPFEVYCDRFVYWVAVAE